MKYAIFNTTNLDSLVHDGNLAKELNIGSPDKKQEKKQSEINHELCSGIIKNGREGEKQITQRKVILQTSENTTQGIKLYARSFMKKGKR